MKKVFAILMVGALATMLLAGCSSGSKAEQGSGQPAQQTVELLNLDGTWKSTNSASEDSWQEAVIDGDAITINWVSDNGDTKSLYWAGTVVQPDGVAVDEVYTWDSENDKSKTDTALLASSDDTKAFTYDNGELSYEASAMGTTKTVRMERIS